MNNTLAGKEALALTKVVKKAVVNKAKENLTVGTHEVNCLVRIQGSITLGEDYNQDFWQIAKPEKTILALVCALNKTTADKITQEQYDRVLSDAEGNAATITDEEAARYKKDREANLKKLREPTNRMAKGKLTAKVTGELVEEASEGQEGSEVGSNADTSQVTAEL